MCNFKALLCHLKVFVFSFLSNSNVPRKSKIPVKIAKDTGDTYLKGQYRHDQTFDRAWNFIIMQPLAHYLCSSHGGIYRRACAIGVLFSVTEFI